MIVLFYLTCDFDYYFDLINSRSIIPSTDVIQLTLTLNMTTAQVVETSVTVNNNSPIQDYVHPHDQTQPTFRFNYYYNLLQVNLLVVCKKVSKWPQ